MISVVIPSYQRKERMLRLLQTVFEQERVELDVVVVDDQSVDGTFEAIRAQFPSARVFRNERNSGPAVSRNRGFAEARSDLVVGLDSDVTLPDRSALSRIEALFAAHPEATGMAFRIYRPDGVSDDIDRWWHPQPVGSSAGKWFPTDYFSGTAFAFRKESFVKAGGFPEVFFIYYEEVELSYRILDDGGTLLYCPEVAVLHHEDRVSLRGEGRLLLQPRNQVLFAIHCYTLVRGTLFLVPRLGYGFLRAVARRRPSIFVRAMWSACRLAPRCLRERKVLRPETWRRLGDLRGRRFFIS